MPRFVVTGCYTKDAVRGMIAKPSDREAATAAIVKAAGGTLESFFLTTGATDFLLVISIDDVTSLGAALMVAGASGAATNLETRRAFTGAEFTEMQKKAGALTDAYKMPG